MKRILITGSSGYIGQHLIKLLQPNYSVYGLDIVNRTDDLLDKSHFYCEDITKNLSDVVKNTSWDTIIHLAALVRVNESVEKPLKYYSTNVQGTINCISNLRYRNFIYSSTGAAEQPIVPYSLSKRISEDIVKQLCPIYTIFRFYNVIGTQGINPTNPDGLFANLICAELKGEFNLYGWDYNTKDGTCIRDYVHVVDICNSIKLAIENPTNNLENLGSGQGISVMEIVELYQKVNNCCFNINYLPRRQGDLESTVLNDISKLMSITHTFDELVKK